MTAFQSTAFGHNMLFTRLEPIAKVIVEQLSGRTCRPAKRPMGRKFRGLYTNAYSAAGSGGHLRELKDPFERMQIRTVYSNHDDIFGGGANGVQGDDEGEIGSHHLWLPVIYDRVEQWPLVLANRTVAQVRAAAGKGASLDNFDWSSIPWIFANRMRLGDFILLRSGVAIHTGARMVNGPAAETPRAAVVLDYICGK